MWKRFVVLVAILSLNLATSAAEPKKLLLVTTTSAFRHSSIGVAEQTIRQLAEQSGDFTVVSTTDSPNYPKYPEPQSWDLAGGRSPVPGGRGGGPGGPRIPGLSDSQQTAVNDLFSPLANLSQAVSAARLSLAESIYASTVSEAVCQERAAAVQAAELELANARAAAVAKLQASADKLNDEQLSALKQDYARVRRGGPGGFGGRGGPGNGPGPRGGNTPLSDTQRAALAKVDEQLSANEDAFTKARTELADAVHKEQPDDAEIKSRVDALAAAELTSAQARATAIAELQSTENKLSDEMLAVMARMYSPGMRGGPIGGPGGRGPAGRGGPPGMGVDPAQMEQVRIVLKEYLSPEELQKYDGVFFLHTTGQLPIPDMPAFLQWVQAGHGVMGSHAAADCFHESDHPGEPHSFIQMLGGEFAGHGAQETVDLHNVDPKHPANALLPEVFQAHDEMYLFKNYEQSKVHSLLNMNQHPNERTAGHYPVSWSKSFGQGRVFYTSLGHRHDIWDPNWKGTDGQRTNDPEVAERFRQHLLGGIRWSLGLVDANP